MLRYVVGVRWRREETWIDYIKRATHYSEDVAKRNNLKEWPELQRSKKWQLAGRTARSAEAKWSRRILDWTPWFRCLPRRSVGRPRARWTEDLIKFAGPNWIDTARDINLWQLLEPGFTQRLN